MDFRSRRSAPTAKREPRCGPADNLSSAVPAIETSEHIKAAEIATREMNAGYLTVILEGKYTDAYLAAAGKDAPKFTAEDLKIISSPVDFIGINVYRPSAYVRGVRTRLRDFGRSRSTSRTRTMLSSWHSLGPEVMYWAPRQRASRCGTPRRSTSPRTAAGRADEMSAEGIVDDSDRIMFLRNHLASSPPRNRGGRARQRLLPLEPDGQFRMERRFRQPVRPGLRRLQDAEANAEAQRGLFPRSRGAERGGLAGAGYCALSWAAMPIAL